MRCGIVIGTTGDDRWVNGLKATLRTEIPVVTVRAWELECIDYGAGRFEEFVFLPQSTEILDNDLWRVVFEEHAGFSVNLGGEEAGHLLRMYLAKYRAEPAREALRQLGTSTIRTKREAIYYEDAFADCYVKIEQAAGRLVTVGGNLTEPVRHEERNGRLNRVVENEYLRRWKGSWNLEMIGTA